jgi:NitT/TauT family transport system ATP-binding protein
MDSDLIIFDKIAKTYQGELAPAIYDVSFSVTSGEFVCIIGPSGCGKSTVLNIIAGLVVPDSGDLKKPDDVSMTFQSGALLPWLTVYDNAALGLAVQHLSDQKVRSEVFEYLDMLKLTNLAEKYPAELSGGQRQRVGIARALAVRPSVLLLDEPFSALDAITTADLHDDIIKIWEKTHKTIVMVSHIIEEAVSLADRVMLMKNGTIQSIHAVNLPYPRRAQEQGFYRKVMEIRKEFFT